MSNKIAIITDTSSTIKPNEIPDVYVVSLLITLNDEKTLLDGREISSQEVYEYFLKNPKTANIKTSLPRATDAIDMIREVASKYDKVIMLPISSGLSGTYNQWRTILESEFADNKNIHLFETSDIAISLKWLVLDVLDMAKKDKSVEEIAAYVKQWHNRISCTVVLNDLTQAYKGGRIGSKVAYYVGGILRIKPILHFHHGKNEIIHKVTTNRFAIEKSFATFENVLKISKNKIAKIGFCNSFVSKEKIKKILADIKEFAKKYGVMKIEESDITPVISCHTGNDAFSINLLIDKK